MAASKGTPIHWTCLVLGLLVSIGALFWLLATLMIGPTPALVITGLVQFAIGVALICAIWLATNSKTAAVCLMFAIVLLIVNTAFAAWLGFGSIITDDGNKKQLPALTVSDPDSPIIVTV